MSDHYPTMSPKGLRGALDISLTENGRPGE